MRTRDQILLEQLYLSIHQKRMIKEGLYDTVKDLASGIGHLALNLAGIIPGVGEFFDLANTIWYIKEEDYFGAALSLIACIPVIGTAVEEAGLIGRAVAGAEKTATSTLEKGASAVVKIGNKVSEFQELIKNNSELIDKVFDLASKNEALKPYVDKMHNALNAFVGGTPGAETGTLSQTQGTSIPNPSL